MSQSIGGFSLVNDEKLDRAINGSVSREGKLSGGVGSKASEEALLAEYDRLGGLIQKDGIKVKTGSFFDFGKGVPRKEPEVVFLTSIDGQIVEVTEDEAKAIQKAQDKLNAVKGKGKKAKTVGEEEVTEDEASEDSETEAEVVAPKKAKGAKVSKGGKK